MSPKLCWVHRKRTLHDPACWSDTSFTHNESKLQFYKPFVGYGFITASSEISELPRKCSCCLIDVKQDPKTVSKRGTNAHVFFNVVSGFSPCYGVPAASLHSIPREANYWFRCVLCCFRRFTFMRAVIYLPKRVVYSTWTWQSDRGIIFGSHSKESLLLHASIVRH